ncbi:MAG: hypothetical protein M2R45_03494 [Verrucomicrobia subdivision 3 bacterium]|nr:hypothetical protein [Limisphaerales bacterium]MCS1415890.1 hypothetical protein [Limisphaerales bacterium]
MTSFGNTISRAVVLVALMAAGNLAVAKRSAVLQSAGPIAFAPGGVLVAADPKAATLVAMETGDTKAAGGGAIKIERVDRKIASVLGATADAIRIVDLAVNPVSHNAYLSVARGRGADATAVIVRIDGSGDIDVFEFDPKKVSHVVLPNAPEDRVTGQGRRARNQRLESITDLSYVDGNIIVAGLSNEEFASTLRSIPFPFESVGEGSSIEIYHGAHGRYETRSPIRTFVPYSIDGESHILAAYTCTPLVKVPVAQLKPGAHVKGTTIAELGNRNRPLDMVVYSKSGKDWFLMANSSRGVMKISTDNLADAPSIISRVEGGGVKGQPYETIKSWPEIFQLAQLDEDYALVLRGNADGALDLESLQYP